MIWGMPGCQECAVLRQKHADAALTHAELRIKLRQAVRDGKGELVTALIISEAAALRDREAAEAALRRHQAVHVDGDAQALTV